ncbi:hypothetical protein KP509_31G061800 [Ceratopteris richardii]|nr:hypothetical protein KP509_31G061800 [Ceratopteris richardii]
MWKRHRKVASFEFSNKKLRDFSVDAFREDALRLVSILQSLHSQRNMSICRSSCSRFIIWREIIVLAFHIQSIIHDLFMRMTLDSICRLGFGVSLGCLSPALPDLPFARAFDTVNEIITTRLFNPFWRFQRALNIGKEKILRQEVHVLNCFTSNIIQQRRLELKGQNDQSKVDLLSRFMLYNKEQPDAFTDRELQDAILNFVIAGRDTSAITLSWFIFCICNYPDVADRVFEEMSDVLGLQDSSQGYTSEEVAKRITYETLGKMHYLHAALTETLRLYPPVPRDGKEVAEDDILPDGTRVKQGDRVAYVPYSMGRMKILWGKDALTYNPDRWLRDGIFQPESPFKFSAFQAGPRICLGKESAYLQMKMTAALLLYFFRFSVVPDHVVHYRVMLVMPMVNGLLVRISLR